MIAASLPITGITRDCKVGQSCDETDFAPFFLGWFVRSTVLSKVKMQNHYKKWSVARGTLQIVNVNCTM